MNVWRSEQTSAWITIVFNRDRERVQRKQKHATGKKAERAKMQTDKHEGYIPKNRKNRQV
jgi:hypothetical protein